MRKYIRAKELMSLTSGRYTAASCAMMVRLDPSSETDHSQCLPRTKLSRHWVAGLRSLSRAAPLDDDPHLSRYGRFYKAVYEGVLLGRLSYLCFQRFPCPYQCNECDETFHFACDLEHHAKRNHYHAFTTMAAAENSEVSAADGLSLGGRARLRAVQ